MVVGPIGASRPGRLWFDSSRRARLAKCGIYDIDRMGGRTFEEYLDALFTKMGYRVELTPYVGDWGADIIVSRGEARTAIQAKRHKKNVEVRAVQEAVAAKGKYKCAAAMVVTNSFYTPQARELARANNVALWDRHQLVSALMSIRDEVPRRSAKPSRVSREEVPFVVATAASAEPASAAVAHTSVGTLNPALTAPAVCAFCGRTVTNKVRDYCVANPQRFGGKVYCYEHQRRRQHGLD